MERPLTEGQAPSSHPDHGVLSLPEEQRNHSASRTCTDAERSEPGTETNAADSTRESHSAEAEGRWCPGPLSGAAPEVCDTTRRCY